MMKKPEVKKNKNGQNGKKKGPHKKQGGGGLSGPSGGYGGGIMVP